MAGPKAKRTRGRSSKPKAVDASRRGVRTPEANATAPSLGASEIGDLHRFLDQRLWAVDCDGTAKFAEEWFLTRGVTLPVARRWLRERTLPCDCKALCHCQDLIDEAERGREDSPDACPLGEADLALLGKTLENELANRKCDDTRRLTMAWAFEHGQDPDRLGRWLDERQAICDCLVKKECLAAWSAVFDAECEAEMKRTIEAASEGLPFNNSEMAALFAMLRGSPELDRDGCPRTDAWLEQRGHSLEKTHRWMADHGGFSDFDVASLCRVAWRALLQRQRLSAHARRRPYLECEMAFLLEMLQERLSREDCDHTLAQTRALLREHCHFPQGTLRWLREGGGFCDCEILLNVADLWLESWNADCVWETWEE